MKDHRASAVQGYSTFQPQDAIALTKSKGSMEFWRALPLAIAVSSGFWAIGVATALALSHTG